MVSPLLKHTGVTTVLQYMSIQGICQFPLSNMSWFVHDLIGHFISKDQKTWANFFSKKKPQGTTSHTGKSILFEQLHHPIWFTWFDATTWAKAIVNRPIWSVCPGACFVNTDFLPTALGASATGIPRTSVMTQPSPGSTALEFHGNMATSLTHYSADNAFSQVIHQTIHAVKSLI